MHRQSRIVLLIGTGMIGMVLGATGIVLIASFLPNSYSPYISFTDRLVLQGIFLVPLLFTLFVLIRAWHYHRRQRYWYAWGFFLGAVILALVQACLLYLMQIPPVG